VAGLLARIAGNNIGDQDLVGPVHGASPQRRRDLASAAPAFGGSVPETAPGRAALSLTARPLKRRLSDVQALRRERDRALVDSADEIAEVPAGTVASLPGATYRCGISRIQRMHSSST
jgi:hypothetical protein